MNCLICRENINNEFVILNCLCKNVFHQTCINKWIDKCRSCPTCRKVWKKNDWKSRNDKLKLIKLRLNNEFSSFRRRIINNYSLYSFEENLLPETITNTLYYNSYNF